MRDRNIDFLEVYKAVDIFIKDVYGTGDGVTEYIRRMEREQYRGPKYIKYWDNDLRMLKHVRWIRNKLVHEVDYDSGICGTRDCDFIELFRQRLYDETDPLALLAKLEKLVRQKRAEAAARNNGHR